MGNNCVGLFNHKYFILFLFYLVYFSAQVAGPFVTLLFFEGHIHDNEEGVATIDADNVEQDANGDNHSDEGPSGSLGMLELLANHPHEFIVFALCNALMLGIGFMLIYQVVILLLNKTTMEVVMDARRNPFRQKSIVKNIESVFGHRKCHWLSPFHEPFPGMKLTGGYE